MSFGASALIHALALAIFAGLLLPVPLTSWERVGQPAVQVVLAKAEPPAAPPAEPPANVASELTRLPADNARTSPTPSEQTTNAPTVLQRIEAQPRSAPAVGQLVPNVPLPDAVPDDAPAPAGDVAVGAAETTDALGHMQSMRLAQRFPGRVDSPPRLKTAPAVAYPATAARTWREARIAALLIVDRDGKVLETTIIPDDPLFAPTVREALLGAVFLPAETDRSAVRHWVILEFVFTLRQLHTPSAPRATRR